MPERHESQKRVLSHSTTENRGRGVSPAFLFGKEKFGDFPFLLSRQSCLVTLALCLVPTKEIDKNCQEVLARVAPVAWQSVRNLLARRAFRPNGQDRQYRSREQAALSEHMSSTWERRAVAAALKRKGIRKPTRSDRARTDAGRRKRIQAAGRAMTSPASSAKVGGAEVVRVAPPSAPPTRPTITPHVFDSRPASKKKVARRTATSGDPDWTSAVEFNISAHQAQLQREAAEKEARRQKHVREFRAHQEAERQRRERERQRRIDVRNKARRDHERMQETLRQEKLAELAERRRHREEIKRYQRLADQERDRRRKEKERIEKELADENARALQQMRDDEKRLFEQRKKKQERDMAEFKEMQRQRAIRREKEKQADYAMAKAYQQMMLDQEIARKRAVEKRQEIVKRKEGSGMKHYIEVVMAKEKREEEIHQRVLREHAAKLERERLERERKREEEKRNMLRILRLQQEDRERIAREEKDRMQREHRVMVARNTRWMDNEKRKLQARKQREVELQAFLKAQRERDAYRRKTEQIVMSNHEKVMNRRMFQSMKGERPYHPVQGPLC